jgi:hypothetical protein
MNKIFVWGAVLMGALLVMVAIFYFMTPAENLPSWMPGFISGSTKIHYKHGVGSLILGIAAFIFAWFRSASAYPAAIASEKVGESVH